MDTRKCQFSFAERGAEDSFRMVWELRNLGRQLCLAGCHPYETRIQSPNYSFKGASNETFTGWISIERNEVTSGGSSEDAIEIQCHIDDGSTVRNPWKGGCRCRSGSAGAAGVFQSRDFGSNTNYREPLPSHARNSVTQNYNNNQANQKSRNQEENPPSLTPSPQTAQSPQFPFPVSLPPSSPTVVAKRDRDLKIEVRAVLYNFKASVLADNKDTLCCSLPTPIPAKILKIPTSSFLKFESQELEKSVLRIIVDIKVWGQRLASSVVDGPTVLPTDAGTVNAIGTDNTKTLTGMERVLRLPRNVMSDIILVCEGKEFPAHKLVLSCVNNRLLELLGPITNGSDTNNIKAAAPAQPLNKQAPAVPVPKTAGPLVKQLASDASQQSSAENPKKKMKTCDQIVVCGITAVTLEYLLDFIYTGKINTSSENALLKLLDAAVHYGVADLKQAIFRSLEMKISFENATIFAMAANKYCAGDAVKQAIFGFCKRNLAKLKNKNAEFKDLFWKTPELLG